MRLRMFDAVRTRFDRRHLARPTTAVHTRRRRYAGWIALVVVGLVVWQGQQRVPMGPAAGTALAHAAADAPALTPAAGAPRLRVGTFNIHGCKGTDEKRDLQRVADCLRGCDVIGLNEVHGPYPWQREDQAQRLGETLHMAWLFAPTEERWWNYQFGNGLLARLPVRSWQRIPLARQYGKSYRNMLLATVDCGTADVRVLVAHIDRSDPRERTEQLRVASELFLSLQPPVVFMGDLNTNRREAALERLLNTPGVVDCVGQVLGADDPALRIDWILARGMKVVDAALVHRGASDHPHLWADLEVAQ